MDLIINSIITPIVESLVVPVKKHLGFLVSSTKYVTDMKEKMNWLNVTEQGIRHNWEEAVARNHEVSNLVEPWLKKVKTMNEEAQSIPTSGIGCFSIAKRYKAGKQSYKILGEIQDLETRKSEIKFTNAQKPLAEVVSTSTWPSTSTRDGTQNNFKSRDVIYNAVLKSLQPQNDSEKMIALCGMAGVGKTTMMVQLEKDVRDSKMFNRVVKVVLGEETNPFALQSAIAEYIREDLNEKTTSARADRLRIVFEGMSQKEKNKVLVIMDDLWNAIDLKDVGLSPLPDGFKLLFTSRFESVCNQMGVKTCSIFNVGVLDDAEAQTLFFENVKLLDGDDPGIQKIGEDIVKKCGGLPIAIVTIAKCLSGNIKEAWEKALQRLEKDDLKDLEDITHRIFEISYENIKEEDDKAFFILSGLFPDDFDIRIEDLLRYGWALGFFKDSITLGIARRDMKVCVNNLLRANLLTKSDRMGCVKLHDLMRAFVLNKISEVKQVSIVNLDNKSDQRLTKDANESYHRILLKCRGITEFPANFNYPNLSMLLLMDGHELLKFPENIYDRMEKLQVVSFENMHIPSLLLTLKHPNQLRTLCLRSCRLINDDLSLLGSLSNLVTLSFIDCEIRILPSSIGELKKLKLLDLTGCVHLRIDDGVFQNLVSLEELYMRAYKDSPVRFTKANYDELEILLHRLFVLELEFFEKPKNMSFKNLERFKISIGCELVELKDGEKNLFRNTIQFVGDWSELLESKISELFSKTEELHLQVNEMIHLEDVLLCHHSFSDLTVLHISKCVDLTCLFTVDVASGLKILERLTISECPIMRTLIENSRVGVIRFQKLNFMSLINLPNMESFWDSKIELPEMVELILDGLPKFKSIYSHSHNASEIQSLLNKKVVIPKLEKLDISNMENLKHIWSCETTVENIVSMLRKIKVRECNNLINLFPSNPLPLLNHLEELEVGHCGAIEVLFNLEFESVCGTWECDSSKLRSISVNDLGKLKELWRMKGVNKCDIHIKCFKGVERITIESCPQFTNIFTPTTINFDLGGLTNYVTKNTGEEIKTILKGEISKMDEYTPNVRYPSYLLHTCHHLQLLLLNDDKKVKEVVFEMDSHQPLLLPYLEDLELTQLKGMSHVWKCHWNKFLIPQHQPLQLPFQNLKNITLENCPRLKYLFSPLMAKYLSNLKSVYIDQCYGVEEVMSSRDDENEENTTSASSHQNNTFFPHLDTLWLNELSCLKSIGGGDQTRSRSGKISSNLTNTLHGQSQSAQVSGACWSLCQYPRRIRIGNCDALSSLVPWYSVRQMKSLQELNIFRCKTMKEVFESESSTSYNVDEGSTPGTTLVVPQLTNLKEVFINGCDTLSHVFTFSTLESLSQLKKLTIRRCQAIQVIVKEENETSSKDIVVFHRLETLELDDLPNLKGFFLGLNDFRWPLLHDVMIDECPQLMVFTSGQSNTPKLKYISTNFGKYSVEYCGLNFHGTVNVNQTTFPVSSSSSDLTVSKGIPWSSFHNLIEIKISYVPYYTVAAGRTNYIIPSNVLLQLEKLEKIEIRDYYGVKEVVFEALEGSGFNESQPTTIFKIPNLTKVKLFDVLYLRYLWKSNRSMVLAFPNLTTLSIQFCDKLEHVFTCSMVGSLVQLQDLEIRGCHNIEVIVKEEEEECCDVKVNLPRLKSLKLISLRSLKGFSLGKEDSSWPLLETLEIVKCPAFKGFTRGYLSTSELKVIKTTFGKWNVKPDLNSFVNTKQAEGYEF